MNTECTADLDHPRDAGFDGAPCASCAAYESEIRGEVEREIKLRPHQTREQYEADVMDAYSDPTERHKRDYLLARSTP